MGGLLFFNISFTRIKERMKSFCLYVPKAEIRGLEFGVLTLVGTSTGYHMQRRKYFIDKMK